MGTYVKENIFLSRRPIVEHSEANELVGRTVGIEEPNFARPCEKDKTMARSQYDDTIPRRRRRRGDSYSSYIYKVLKYVHPDKGISKMGMVTMNNFVEDMFARLMLEASLLARYVQRATLSSREIQTAVRLVLPGELAKHAVSEGTKAVTLYSAPRTAGKK